MCNPLLAAGAAMTAASMFANSQAASQVAKKRDDVVAAENIRQKGYQQQADAVNDQSQGRYQDFTGQQAAKSTSLGDYFAGQAKALPADAPKETVASPVSSNVLVNNEVGNRLAQAKGFGAQQDTALGNLRSFGDLLGGISRQQGVDAAKLGTIGGFMRGSQGVVPLELDAANSAGNGLQTFGSLLGLGGNLATMGGLVEFKEK